MKTYIAVVNIASNDGTKTWAPGNEIRLAKDVADILLAKGAIVEKTSPEGKNLVDTSGPVPKVPRVVKEKTDGNADD